MQRLFYLDMLVTGLIFYQLVTDEESKQDDINTLAKMEGCVGKHGSSETIPGMEEFILHM